MYPPDEWVRNPSKVNASEMPQLMVKDDTLYYNVVAVLRVRIKIYIINTKINCPYFSGGKIHVS